MVSPSSVTIVNVGYRSANVWVVSAGTSRLLVDLGWPGMVGRLLANLGRQGIPLAEVRYGLATHYHPDHAGAAQDLKNRGMRLILTEEQVEAVPRLKRWTKPKDGYTEITMHDNLVIRCAESRAFLAQFGIAGEIVHTPGHSDDSITLVLDGGRAFVGDLAPEGLATDEVRAAVARSWQTLRDLGVTTIHAGHGPVRHIAAPFEER
ncbi:MAG TPA: MBL fold metallo-hydrolase [Candidatus Eisenbacteria bacterium]|jgi:glyoxylase-like metal-dependent hydrolase (beta-lactamase superfamily II)